MKLQATSYKLQANRGFTLVEILAVLAIFVIVTLIVLVGSSHFNNTILLTNLAYDVALTVTRAQSYGTDVRQFGTGTDSFSTNYGVHFRLCGTTADPKESDDVSFVLYAFNHSNLYYTNPDGFLERYLIRRGNKINKLYGIDSSNVATEVYGVDIAFVRPDLDANFAFFDCSGTPVFFSDARAVRVEVVSPAGLTKNIIIEAAGQASVQ